MTYEYKTVDFDFSDWENLEIILNEYAKSGWEYINCVPRSFTTGAGKKKLVFRRALR